ncbi:MAG TPA: OB-fold domain-containing protein [Burkholderiaceae bacterium]|nr:OB-fold domain-containing protein [Burkholderiaceae bacterium]
MLGHPVYSPWKGLQNVESAKPFISALRQGRFVLQVCARCARSASPGRLRCEYCRSAGLVWRRAQGSGRIVAFTLYHRQYDHEYERKVPYDVVLVRLDCGVLLLGSVAGTAGQELVGSRVRLDLEASARGMPLKFLPVEESVSAETRAPSRA